LEYDIERLFTKILVHTVPSLSSDKIEYRLLIKFNGVTAIEELTFCKIMLFSYIYYHQKVLVSETMIKDYAYGLCKLGFIKSFADFLRYTDSDILGLARQQRDDNPFPGYAMLRLNDLALRIKNRKLPKRCFEISQSNIEPLETLSVENANKQYFLDVLEKIKTTDKYDFDDFKQDIMMLTPIIMRSNTPLLDDLISEYRELTFEDALIKRKDFYDALIKEYAAENKTVRFTMFDVYLVFPKLVNYGATTDAVILGKDNTELMTINDFVKLDDWAASFNSNKWRGYVFVSEKIDRAIAFKTAQKLILKDKAKLKNPTAYLKGIVD
jgi:hypothetical protein